ncbi:MAG: branched-chain-amino-acid transaminase [Candidatus Sumerlaeota bacterium]|nr:branched-chain-amino-acid transaminase [Candidatus Sumerlaeota bacterium]
MRIFIDGKFYDKDKAKISVFDHGLLYGDGVFEGIRVYNGCIFRWKDHLERLFDSAKFIMLDIPMTREELTDATIRTCQVNGLSNGYIRLVVTRGEGDLGLSPWLCKKASVIIIASTIQLYPPEYYEKGLSIITVPTHRNHFESLNPRVKSLNYLNNILAKIEARQAGVMEALLLSQDGYVNECTGDNIFIIKNRALYTPPVTAGILKGVTRQCVMECAEAAGYEVREQVFTRFEIYTADECFLTGTAAEAIPVVKVDSRSIGDGKPGPITKELIERFRAHTGIDGVMIPQARSAKSAKTGSSGKSSAQAKRPKR